MEKNDDGSMGLKIHFPDDSFLGNFAEVLGKIAARKKWGGAYLISVFKSRV